MAGAGGAGGAGAGRKVARGYQAAERLAAGTLLAATGNGNVWRLAQPVGTGGFGDIYSAYKHNPDNNTKGTTTSTAAAPFVVKIEPHENGPLFVEMHFYMRNAKREDVEEYMKSHKLKSLGMPIYIASGSHEFNKRKYRFIVMERFGKDLWQRFLECDRKFPTHTVFRIALQMLDVYEYIHGRSYVHADLKGGNILFGMEKNTENQAYLVDFGLASHFTTKEFKRDPKKTHNGTIEYTSRDAHNGVPTRRGDMEILGYNLVQWLTGSLPWETDLRNPVKVQEQKEKYMSDIPGFIKKCFNKSNPPDSITSYMQYVGKMKYDDIPDYNYCKKLFESGLKSLGYSLNCNLEFSATKANGKSPKTKTTTQKEKPSKVVKAKKVQKTITPQDTSQGRTTRSSIKASVETDDSYSFIGDVSAKNGSAASVDIFEDSRVETPPKRGTKRKYTKKFAVEYCTDEEVTVHTTVKRKGGVVKEVTKSWKKCPTVVNGRSVKNETT